LLLIFECNHHLALHAGALLAADAAQNKEKETLSQEQVFVEALSIVSCVVMKSVLKREYNLSSEQCATFNPKDIRQERIKAFPTGGFGAGRDEGAQAPSRNRFPASEWLERISPLVENFGRPDEIIAYVRTVTDADPWDDSKSRHEAKVDALEGRRRKKSAPKAPPAPAAAAPRGRGRGRGRGGKAAAKKKARRHGGGDTDSDSDYEEPGVRKRQRVKEPPAAENAEEGFDQEEAEEELEQEDVD